MITTGSHPIKRRITIGKYQVIQYRDHSVCIGTGGGWETTQCPNERSADDVYSDAVRSVRPPMIKWHGGAMPVTPGTRIKVWFRGTPTMVDYCDRPEQLRWNHLDGYGDIIAYEIIE